MLDTIIVCGNSAPDGRGGSGQEPKVRLLRRVWRSQWVEVGERVKIECEKWL